MRIKYEDFMKEAFTQEEQEKILLSSVPAHKHPDLGTYAGNPTEDKIFLLSMTEANQYFESLEERACAGTAYCYAQGVERWDDGNCWWWLRSPGISEDVRATVHNFGTVHGMANYSVVNNYGVRPAMWITLEESGNTERSEQTE